MTPFASRVASCLGDAFQVEDNAATIPFDGVDLKITEIETGAVKFCAVHQDSVNEEAAPVVANAIEAAFKRA